ncbi:hypothetical protein INR49_028788 [Caranx melampygus]|nr:hypothetical protein INR49_028788 [Caranx melampygus]
MDLDLETFDTTIPAPPDSLELGLSMADIPSLPLELPLPGATEAAKTEMAPDQEIDMKSEPPSPAPSVPPTSPQAYTLELGSEVDVLDAEKTATSLTPNGSIQTTAPIVLSIPTSHIVVVLTNKTSLPSCPCRTRPSRVPRHRATAKTTPESTGSSRTKPYSKSEPTASSPSAKAPKVKSVSGAPKVVEKKLKKMEQNKTAATRYRQKKRVEQEQLNTEREELEKRNRELAEKAESISREIQYLKDLMEEVRKHRRGKTSPMAFCRKRK